MTKKETKKSIIDYIKILLKSESKFTNNGTISKFRNTLLDTCCLQYKNEIGNLLFSL